MQVSMKIYMGIEASMAAWPSSPTESSVFLSSLDLESDREVFAAGCR